MTVKVVIRTTGLEPIYMHQSWIETAALCLAKHDPRHLEHPDYDPTPTEAMSWGSALHAVVEEGVRQGGQWVPSPSDVKAKWMEVAAKDKFNLEAQWSAAKLGSACMNIRDGYLAWQRQVWPRVEHFTMYGIEEEIATSIGHLPSGREVFLRGTPDLVVYTETHDWKSHGGKGWDQGKADGRIQGPLYAVLADANHPEAGPIERMVYWIYPRLTGEWQRLEQEVSPAMKTAALASAMEWAAIKEVGAYPPTPTATTGKTGRHWTCTAKYCHAWDVCALKALVSDEADLTVKRAKGWG